jgi:NADH:ubiquinone oxidoreductase subunit H
MVLLMIMTARRRVMGEFTIGYGLKTLGWAATLAMVACVIGRWCEEPIIPRESDPGYRVQASLASAGTRS